MKTLLSAIGAVMILGFGALWLRATPPSPKESQNVPSAAGQPQVVVVNSPQLEPERATATPATVVTPPLVGIHVATAAITAGVRTTILVESTIDDPALIAGSVNLLRIGSPGSQPLVLGQLHDDGLNGDAFSGDTVYTLALSFNEPSSTTAITLQVSAAFKGRMQRVLSPQVTVSVSNVAESLTPYTNSQQHLQLMYPSALQPGQNGDTLTWFDPAHPELDVEFEIAVFTPTGANSVLDVAKQALGTDFLSVAFYTPTGLVVRDSTSLGMHYFAYNLQTNRAVEFGAFSPDYFSTSEFSLIAQSIQIQ